MPKTAAAKRKTKTTPYDVTEYLHTPEDVAAYLDAWLTEAPDAKEAFIHLVGIAATLSNFRCHAQHKGVVRDFRFITEDGQQCFAVIPNKQWLLFYFRKPALQNGPYAFQELQQVFDAATENARGEWTVRLRSVADVQRLWAYVHIW